MKKITNRREFFSISLGSAAVALLGRAAAKAESAILRVARDAPPFEMVVLGDSIMWGQGLPEEQKFYYLVGKWIESEAFGNRRKVGQPIVEAHSGATIFPDGTGGNALFKKAFSGETNISNPCILHQVENALKTCKARSIAAESVGLVLVNGGINDLNAKKFLEFVLTNEEIRNYAREYCGYRMRVLLKSIAVSFPNAKIILTGYYPIISEATNHLEIDNLLKGIIGVKLPQVRRFFEKLFKIRLPDDPLSIKREIRDKLAQRCSLWTCESDKNFRESIEGLNEALAVRGNVSRAFFVPVRFEKEHSYGAKNTYLWRVEGRDLRTDDPLFSSRKISCKKDGKGFIEHFICHRAGAAHPNVLGAKAYADAITEKLSKDVIPYAGWN